MLLQPAAEGATSRDAALTKVLARVAEQRSALERLGAHFEADDPEVVIDWQNEWGVPLAPFVPLAPSLLRAGVARLAELESELDALLAALSHDEWEQRDGPGGWSVRTITDHLAASCGLFMLRVEIWPLDPDTAQAAALDDLVARVALFDRQPRALEQFGWNVEGRRVRWTARKVVRVVGELQESWLEYAAGGPAPPEIARHEDADGDNDRVDEHELAGLRQRDLDLRRVTRGRPRVFEIAFQYRYYRDRLIPWPSDELERWRAMRSAFRERLLSFDERELACVRVSPNGGCTSVRQQLALALGHIPEHRAQIEQIRAAAKTSA